MSISTTGTRAEVLTAHDACYTLAIMLRQIIDGSGSPAAPGRFTAAQVDTQITAAQAALTALAS